MDIKAYEVLDLTIEYTQTGDASDRWLNITFKDKGFRGKAQENTISLHLETDKLTVIGIPGTTELTLRNPAPVPEPIEMPSPDNLPEVLAEAHQDPVSRPDDDEIPF